MLSKKFAHVLQFNPIKAEKGESKGRMEKIKYRDFKKSTRTMRKIKQAGLENEIEDSIEVEANYKITKIVGYGATSTVYKAKMFSNREDAMAEKETEDLLLGEKSPRNSKDKSKF